ncbi:MAG: sensor histidine kinase [Nocardioidaceae bacterium]|nr:sensor histidine kinase [Nocardioidaceae bacterium]NUS49833.1 sensor histidine kinase [Nocardioidaceae bacterium]
MNAVSSLDATGGWTTRDGRAGRFGVVFAAVWLVFLVDSLREAWRIAWSDQNRVAGFVGLLAIVAFAVTYLAIFGWVRARRRRAEGRVPPAQGWLAIGALGALMLVMVLAIGQEGMAAVVYVVVVGVLVLPTWWALSLTVALAALVEVTGRTLPGWTEQAGLTFAVCTAAFAMWGVSQLMMRNLDLLRAREENARLAVADERNRFARDLHDILGHSLTVITLKAELANRLIDVDPERARTEIADLERLSRDALADVRRTVEGYRDLTLPGELARAREALRAADIEADLPNSTDDVPSELRELFAWTVREGVTNVIRHSRATRCSIRLAPDRVEVTDDGTGPPPDAERGHGLDGLHERAASLGAVLVTRTLDPGFALRVSVP